MAAPFYKVQAADEATAGTAVAATAKWNSFNIRPNVGDRTIVQPEEDRGSLAMFHTGYTTSLNANLGNLEGDCTYEDVILPALMALETVTPTQPNSATDPNEYLWTFDPSWTAANTAKTFTVEWGDDVQMYESEYVFATGLTISGETDGAWQISAPLVGRQNTSASFTGSLTDRTLERAIFNKGTIYFDDSGGTIGTTEFACDLVNFSWNLPLHFEPFHGAGGQLYFCGVQEHKVAPTLTVTMVLDSANKVLMTTDYTAETVQLIRVRTTGAIMDNNAKYINLDGGYRILDISPLEASGGLTLATFTLGAEYDSGLASMFSLNVLNGVSAIP